MVILVDHNDVAIGTMEKMEAHRKGQLHRAFSVLVYNSKGEILLQKRALNKYHSGGLWTNACCSHPLSQEKKWKMLPAEDSEKKWASISSQNMRINLFTKPILTRISLSMNTIMFTKQRSMENHPSIKRKWTIGNLLTSPG
jgi:isopentenyl-diphosphate delta-isomerase type 1